MGIAEVELPPYVLTVCLYRAGRNIEVCGYFFARQPVLDEGSNAKLRGRELSKYLRVRIHT